MNKNKIYYKTKRYSGIVESMPIMPFFLLDLTFAKKSSIITKVVPFRGQIEIYNICLLKVGFGKFKR